MSRPASSPESISAWGKTTAHLNTWKNPTKSTPTGLSIFTLIPAWTPCGTTYVSRTCCSESASRTDNRDRHQRPYLLVVLVIDRSVKSNIIAVQEEPNPFPSKAEKTHWA